MTARSNGLLMAGLAVSVGAHLLLLLLVPWKPIRPRPASREIVPVRLVHVAPPVSPTIPRPRRTVAKTVEVPPPEQVAEAPEPVVQAIQQEAPAESEPSVELSAAPGQSVSIEGPLQSATAPASTAEVQGAEPVPVAAPQPSAEIAAYQAILSALRERAIREIRYPPLARANGWKGTVIVSLRLDGSGKLQQAVVRQTSGYEVLDRAATRLAREITPVPNPLGLPVTIEVPITYELK